MKDQLKTRQSTTNIPPYGLRMQPDLKARLEQEASAAGRSLNAEIVARLEESFGPEYPVMTFSNWPTC
jgi:hypothetical protein